VVDAVPGVVDFAVALAGVALPGVVGFAGVCGGPGVEGGGTADFAGAAAEELLPDGWVAGPADFGVCAAGGGVFGVDVAPDEGCAALSVCPARPGACGAMVGACAAAVIARAM
jgi:hypothetical protein